MLHGGQALRSFYSRQRFPNQSFVYQQVFGVASTKGGHPVYAVSNDYEFRGCLLSKRRALY